MASSTEHSQRPPLPAETIQQAVEVYESEFLVAASGSETTGKVWSTLCEFLRTPSLPVYYKIKVFLAMSEANEEEDESENIRACRYHLRKAEKALNEARKAYVKDEGDAQTLDRVERDIQVKREQLVQREAQLVIRP